LDINVARKINPVLNDKSCLEPILDYVNYRIEVIRKNLETVSDPMLMYKYQGQILELRRFLTLKDEALEELKRGKQTGI
jgi:hypothetical protein